MTTHLKTLFTFFIVLSVSSMFAQTVTAGDFLTATNASANGTIAVGTNDLHWQVSDLSINGPYVPAKSCGYVYNGWHFPNVANANWISYPNTCVSGDYAEHSCLNPAYQDRYYKNSFYLPGTSCESSTLAPGIFCLNLNLRADNCIYEVFVNGISVFTTTSTNPYWHMGYTTGAAEVITLCNNWKSGLNEIIVHVTSSAGTTPTWEGLLATASLTFNGVANQTIVPMSLSATGSTINCNSQSTGTAAAIVVGGGPTISYTWLPSGGNAALASNLSAGIYTVAVSSGGCTKSETVNIAATNAPTVTVSGPAKSLCRGELVTLTASGAQFYTWQPGNGNTASINVIAAAATVYTVMGSTSNGCSNIKTISVIANECTDLEKRQGDFTNVNVWPNPSRTFLIVQHPENARLTLHSALGRIVYQSASKWQETKIDVSQLPQGIYYLDIQLFDLMVETIKVMIEH